MKIGERVFVQCECHGPSHIMEFELGGSAAEPELTVWYMLNPRLPLHKRLVTAALYVLGRTSWRTAQWLDFDEFHLDDDAAEKVKDACGTYLEAWRARVSEQEAKDRLIEMCRRSKEAHGLARDWAECLSEKLSRPAKEIEEEGLRASDFPNAVVRLRFEDRSSVVFEHAFLVRNDDDIAVFSEHCGYHIFKSSSVVQTEERAL